MRLVRHSDEMLHSTSTNVIIWERIHPISPSVVVSAEEFQFLQFVSSLSFWVVMDQGRDRNFAVRWSAVGSKNNREFMQSCS